MGNPDKNNKMSTRSKLRISGEYSDIRPFSISYIIPIEEELDEDFSPLQGFSNSIMSSVEFIFMILSMPQNIFEPFSERDRIINIRMEGGAGYQILPIHKQYIKNAVTLSPSPFICIFSSAVTSSEVEKCISEFSHPILHISKEPTKTGILIEKLQRSHFIDYINSVTAKIHGLFSQKDNHTLNKLTSSPKKWKMTKLSLIERSHLSTIPNETILRFLNYKFSRKKNLIGISNEPYVKAILDSAKIIINKRKRLNPKNQIGLYPPAISLILAAPSLYKHVYKTKISLKETLKLDHKGGAKKVFKMIQKQTGYSYSGTADDFNTLKDSKAGQYLLGLRRDEIAAFTSAVTVKACNHFAPVIRLPAKINLLRPNLQRLASCARGNSPHKLFKMNKIFSELQDDLRKAIGDPFENLISKNDLPIKIISDAPIEWFPSKGLPLSLRNDVSRIPSTPGNVMFGQSIQGPQEIIETNQFKNILIIRSFKKNDPIRNILVNALDTMLNSKISLQPLLKSLKKSKRMDRSERGEDPNNKLKLNIKLVDVNSEEEFVKALNDFDGPILIFDGHGSHDVFSHYGSLLIDNKRLDTWTLKGKARIPPIVLLSACDTHPIDGSHASTANGFLAVGAKTVIGTLLPLKANEAAIFISRLLQRIQQFLPIYTKTLRRSIRWSEVVTGMQRMLYVTESLHLIQRKGAVPINRDSWYRISFESNEIINRNILDWWEKFKQLIKSEIELDGDVIENIFNTWIQLPECIKYIQLGNPELILITE